MADQNDQNDQNQTPPQGANQVKSGKSANSFVASAKSWYTNPETRKTAIILTLVAVAAVGVGGVRLLQGPPKPTPDADQVRASHVHGAPGGNKGSAAYNRQLAQANHDDVAAN
ncbi:hypothetical protein HFU84_03900 [Acidithiobacillus sp. CV18-2]|nr:hypothetical protein [Acidithiobacillus sp. CV18-3]MBU2755907.1 hypothetical protein [Acidithiobacillus sp. BN09-2]MBU2776658.1 hypothetical protein [Acidithiobacillus sp. CV18-2]MBU2799216.1 hypothetical protein [Acidithiobacillus sp. VAN18-4]